MEKQYQVLIADDSAFARKIARASLEGTEFCASSEAKTGIEAVGLFKKSNFDLVLLDVVMPDMDGADALKGIMDADPNALVVMLSSMGSEEMVTKCLSLGARSFIQKPFDRDVLVKHLRKVINERKEVAHGC